MLAIIVHKKEISFKITAAYRSIWICRSQQKKAHSTVLHILWNKQQRMSVTLAGKRHDYSRDGGWGWGGVGGWVWRRGVGVGSEGYNSWNNTILY